MSAGRVPPAEAAALVARFLTARGWRNEPAAWRLREPGSDGAVATAALLLARWSAFAAQLLAAGFPPGDLGPAYGAVALHAGGPGARDDLSYGAHDAEPVEVSRALLAELRTWTAPLRRWLVVSTYAGWDELNDDPVTDVRTAWAVTGRDAADAARVEYFRDLDEEYDPAADDGTEGTAPQRLAYAQVAAVPADWPLPALTDPRQEVAL